MTWSLHLLWTAHQFMNALSLLSLLLRASQSFSTLNHHHFKAEKLHSAAMRPHEKHHFRTVSYPGPLQTANLPVESCWALKSCNTEHFPLAQVCQPNWFLIRATVLQSDVIKIPAFIRWITVAVVLLTWHDALVHQLLPSSSLLKPQLQDWKTIGKCYQSRQTDREIIW